MGVMALFLSHEVDVDNQKHQTLTKMASEFSVDPMQVTVTQAKHPFGAVCAPDKTEPAFVENDGRMDTVIVSTEQFSELQAAHCFDSLPQRKVQLAQLHGAWFAEQDQRFEAHGLWCDDMRVW